MTKQWDEGGEILARRLPLPAEPDTSAERLAMMRKYASDPVIAEMAKKLDELRGELLHAKIDLRQAQRELLEARIQAAQPVTHVKTVEIEPADLCILQGVLCGLAACGRDPVVVVEWTGDPARGGRPLLSVGYRARPGDAAREDWVIDDQQEAA